MAALDRSKPFGEVFGAHATRFEQGGKAFDANGDEIVEKPEPKAEAPAVKPEVMEVDDQLAKQIGEAPAGDAPNPAKAAPKPKRKPVAKKVTA